MGRLRGPELVAGVRAAMSVVGVCALVAGGVAVITSGPAGATTFTVSNTTDSTTAGSNSLRDIIQNQATSAGGDEVDLVAGATYTLNVCNPPDSAGGQLTHGNTPLTIATPSGAPATIRQTCAGRVLEQGTGLVTVNNVIITGGNVGGPTGGGISAAGAVTVLNSTITGNTVGVEGGGIGATGLVTVTNSTVSGNQSGDPGGGIFAGSVAVTNSTITNNTSTVAGGGIDAGSVTLVYATVARNTGTGGANVATPVGAGATLTSVGSVIALPQGGGANCVGVTNSIGFNWDDDGSCGFGAGPGDHSNGGNPQLGALANNGGPTQTLLPLAGSPLIDAVAFAHCGDGNTLAGSTITADQRLLARPSPAGGACDVGAVEVQVAVAGPAPVVMVPRFTG